MLDTIKAKIREIEEKENIKVLYCVESGSRAWGFASPDSDYDVRFIYIRRPEDYLRINRPKDYIEWQLDEVLDINGWDIQKALKLLYKSNPTVFEWCGSPIVYKESPSWHYFKNIIPDYFVSKKGMYHYLSMAKGNYREYLKGDEVRLKKYLYVLRPVLACKWILDKNSYPPMKFSELVEAELEDYMKPVVADLLKAKMSAGEKEYAPKIIPLNEYLEKNISELEEKIERIYSVYDNDEERLEKVFMDILKEEYSIL